MKLDAKGRCCGRKPIDYKGGPRSPEQPHKYCPRCNRSFDRESGKQIENWAFKKCPGCGCWISGSASACGECICEQEGA